MITRTDARRLKYLGISHRSIVAPKGFGANPRGRHQLNEFLSPAPGLMAPPRGTAPLITIGSLLAFMAGIRRHRPVAR